MGAASGEGMGGRRPAGGLQAEAEGAPADDRRHEADEGSGDKLGRRSATVAQP